MQSGYSELMGLYPPGTGTPLTKPQADAVSQGVASPPFKVRDADALNEKLGLDPLPGRPELVPIISFNNNDIADEVSYDGYPFIGDTENARIDDEDVFGAFDWMMDQDRSAIQETYGLSDEEMNALNFHYFETYTDEAKALEYEGDPVHEQYYSETQWELTHQF